MAHLYKKVQMMRYASFSLTVLACLAATPALADIPAVIACADQAESQARLACYDAAVIKLKTELVEAQKRKATLFGFNLPFGDTGSGDTQSAQPSFGPKEINEVDAKLTGVTKDLGGHAIITLDNGQTWRIEDALHPQLIPGRDSVAIVRNIFGGFYLNLQGHTNNLSVTRLK